MWILDYLRTSGKGNEWHVPIANVHEVKKRALYRGAYPGVAGYSMLGARMGVRSVLSLIEPEQLNQYAADKDECAGLGIAWRSCPMSDREVPLEQTIADALRLITTLPGAVYVHCEGGRHRTGLVVAVYRVVVDGWTKERAWKEADAFGFYSARGHGLLKIWFFEAFDPAAIARRAGLPILGGKA